MFKKIFLSFVLLAVLAAGGLSFYVSTIDWNLHKDKIALQFEQFTGKKIVFNGPVSLEFLPKPTLTAQDIKIFNPNQAPNQTPLASIDELVSDLSVLELLKGSFEVNKMVLRKPKILVEFSKDGRFNWQPEKTVGEDDFAPAFNVAFNSIMLDDALIHIVNPALETDITMEKVNAEISAQSLNGPYRIDGNFVKDNNPAGFALNIGNITESFATSVNLAITHPTSSSYARFDGSVQVSTNEIKGNFTMESKNPSMFINDLANQVILPEKYNYPLESSVELNINNQQIGLSSFIIKYGDKTAGAGNILIPLIKPVNKNEKRVISIQFDMTNLDLDPIAAMITEQLKLYDNGKLFHPYSDFDVVADIRAVKALYRGENLRNLNLSAQYANDILTIKNLNALLPGDTETTISGDIFENDEALSYKLEVQTFSQDFLAFLTWLGVKPEIYAPSTYKNTSTAFEISGNLNQIRVQPYRISFDRSVLEGLLGIVRKPEMRYFIAVQGDNINFDNYLPQLTKEEQTLPFIQKLTALINKLSFLNNLNLHFEGKLNLGIYNKTPFENLNINFDTQKGIMALKNLTVDNVLSSSLSANGEISGLGTIPNFKDLKFNISNQDFAAFMPLVENSLPECPLFRKAKTLKAEGTFNGTFEQASLDTRFNLDEHNVVYNGSLTDANTFGFNGNLELKTPDFISFVKALGFDYKPQNTSINIFTFKGNVSGNSQNYRFDNMESFVGSSRFTGSVNFNRMAERPSVITDLTINNFEFSRFFYNINQPKGVVLKRGTTNETLFLEKPLFNTTTHDFEFFKTFDLEANLAIDNLSFGATDFQNTKTNVKIKDNIIHVADFSADYHQAPVKLQFDIDLTDSPKIKGTADIQDYTLENVGGSRYRVSGKLSANAEFDAPVTSEADFVSGLNGSLKIGLSQASVNGWNLSNIETDLTSRAYSDNLFDMLRENLTSGQTVFSQINADIAFENGAYRINSLSLDSAVAEVEATGSGTISKWDILADFKLTFKNLAEKIVPIMFKWTGALSMPNMIIEAEALKEKYDSHWANIEREKQEAEAQRINALNEKMNLAQENIKRLKTDIVENILPLIEKYKPLSTTSEIQDRYNVEQMQLVDMNNRLDIMLQKSDQEFEDQDIIEINAFVEANEPQIQKIKQSIEDIYVLDLKTAAAKSYKEIMAIVNNTQTKSVNYKTTLNAYVIRLKQLESAVDLDNDPLAQDFIGKIEAAISQINQLNDEASVIKNVAEQSTDINILEKQKEKMADVLTRSQQQLQILTTELENLFAYVQKLVYVEEYGEVVPTNGEKPKVKERIQIIETPKQQSEETSDISEPEQDTLLSQVQDSSERKLEENENIVSYTSQSVPTGSIYRQNASAEVEEKTEEKPRLLRPTARKTIVSGGVIKKK